jgi:hypothetical protein
MLTENKDITIRWQEYISELFDDERESEKKKITRT